MENTPDFNPADLPQATMKEKQIYQYPQPADTGGALKEDHTKSSRKEADKTSKEEGLNQELSSGDAGAFEGFEDQSE